jgi:hypothetical protein
VLFEKGSQLDRVPSIVAVKNHGRFSPTMRPGELQVGRCDACEYERFQQESLSTSRHALDFDRVSSTQNGRGMRGHWDIQELVERGDGVQTAKRYS